MISSNPYHPLTYSGGITHTWMGESWRVDGVMSVMVVMKISSKSPSRQGTRMEFLVSNGGGAAEIYLGKMPSPRYYYVRGYM
jgi:hypothetical protein